MDCTTELAVNLQMLRFKLASIGEMNAVTLAPLVSKAERALTAVKQTQEDLATIVHTMSKALDQQRALVAQLKDMITRIVRSQGGRLIVSKDDLEVPIGKGTILSNGIMEDGGLEIVVEDTNTKEAAPC